MCESVHVCDRSCLPFKEVSSRDFLGSSQGSTSLGFPSAESTCAPPWPLPCPARWGLKSGPHVCILPTEQPPQHLKLITFILSKPTEDLLDAN